MKFKIKKWNELSRIKKLMRIFDLLAISVVLLHCSFYVRAELGAEDNAQRIFIIDSPILYNTLNPFSWNSLGTSLPFGNIGYLNKSKIEETNTRVEDVLLHEAKHLEQYKTLGLIKTYQLDSWKVEGVAEYARGSSTIDICESNPIGSKVQLDYRDYHIVVKYLIESQALDEESIYDFTGYPIGVAAQWVEKYHCDKKQLTKDIH